MEKSIELWRRNMDSRMFKNGSGGTRAILRREGCEAGSDTAGKLAIWVKGEPSLSQQAWASI
jgi:hypothetical protein